jgi:hypothetical protein
LPDNGCTLAEAVAAKPATNAKATNRLVSRSFVVIDFIYWTSLVIELREIRVLRLISFYSDLPGNFAISLGATQLSLFL